MKFRKTVPQIFFDLIARIIPGVAILLGIIFTIMEYNEFYKYLSFWFKPLHIKGDVEVTQIPSVMIIIIIGFIVSYILGLVVWGIDYLLRKYFVKEDENIDLETGINIDKCKKSNECNLSKHNLFCGIKKFDEIYFMIKHNYPEAGYRITKLKAEIHMSATLRTAFAILCIVNSFKCLFNMDLFNANYISIIVLMFLISIGSWSVNEHLKEHVCSCVNIVSNLKEKESTSTHI